MSFLFREMAEVAIHRFLQNGSSRDLRKILMKTPVLKFHFNKMEGLQSANLLRRNSGAGVFL